MKYSKFDVPDGKFILQRPNGSDPIKVEIETRGIFRRAAYVDREGTTRTISFNELRDDSVFVTPE